MSQPRVPLVSGVPVGAPGSGARITDLAIGQKFIDLAFEHGVKNFDSAEVYSKGTNEEFLGKLDLKDAVVDTKASPFPPGAHSAANLLKAASRSAAKLAPHKINVYYLHAPDHSVPYEESCEAINKLYRHGLIKEFGLSNYSSWEVAEIYYICKTNGWILPTVYQGRYNAVQREVEAELFPCLRKFGIRFYVYSPLAGALLTGNILSPDDLDKRTGSRYDPKISPYASVLRDLATPVLPVVKELAEEIAKYKIPLPEVATRWIQHHSLLDPEKGDRVIIGSSSLEQLEKNLMTHALGPLPEEVLQVINAAGIKAMGLNKHYGF
ncbi:Aldo/keto reductase [Schizophyllum commune H4-8]|uniref:Aldo/keto reductase n=1 Tax=Schizophyllum commune (strain H4-8 / FGSC 9210) TaxID=578458 RepID=UPI00215EC9AA|nr:Aldo/keto reductase [Schizophyllum commune H4-8]KAI5900350.1 Aldo/keto reductase [Schizophyllum commune H4-8]